MNPKAVALAAFASFVAANDSVSMGWLDLILKGGIGAAFAYYLFVHAPKQEESSHRRRMEELKYIAELLKS